MIAMGWFSRLFQPAPRLSPSGSLPVAALQSIAEGLCFNASASHGVEWIATPIANTNSMLPLMDANCVVLLERTPFESLRPGDIVTYRSTRQNLAGVNLTILHRLGERDAAGRFVIAGDNNAVNDGERVSRDNFDRRLCGILYGAKNATTDL